MTLFVQFVEHNEHEGESWCFWIQETGNTEEIQKLYELIEAEDLEHEYEVTDHYVPEHEVNIVVEHGNFCYTYMPMHQKVSGKLTIPAGFQVNDLYKGGIKDLFKE